MRGGYLRLKRLVMVVKPESIWRLASKNLAYSIESSH